MKTIPALAVAIAAAAAALVLAGGASAHPLGNFTINHYAGIEAAGDRVYLRVALDLAEIPTVQRGAEVSRPGFARGLADALVLRLDGRRAPLVLVERRVTRGTGAGGLATVRLDAVYRAVGTGSRLDFRDTSFGGSIGWREITVRARDGARVAAATAPEESRSRLLHAYPGDLLSAPLDVREASATLSLGTRRAAPPSIGDAAPAVHRGGGFESLVARGELSAGVVLVSLAIAMFWGAAHALTPGHGKALVAGYLIGSRGRPRDALLLGATVTLTHTAGVFGLGLVTLALSAFIVPETLYPWLTLVSGLLVVAVGLSVLVQRLRAGGWLGGHDHGDHPHSHGHDHAHHHGLHGHHHHGSHPHDRHGHDGHHHAHGHDHDHRDDQRHQQAHDRPTRRGIVGVGVAAGLLPCPSALVVLLGAIALHRVGFGLALIVAFSLGLAATITGLGLLVVLARGALGRRSLDGPVVRALPAVSALVILGVGIALTVRAVPAVV